MTERSPQRGILLCLALATLLALPLVAAAAQPFSIEGAQWKAEKAELRIEGWAPQPDAAVLVRDADSSALVGAAAVRADGKWLLRVRRPRTVPTRMTAEYGGAVLECEVAGASADPVARK